MATGRWAADAGSDANLLSGRADPAAALMRLSDVRCP